MLGRDIFKHGASPELQARMDRLEALEREFWATPAEEREAFLTEHPEIESTVVCEACKQIEPGPRE